MALLNSADYPAIRAAIDVSLDAATLPDSVIAMDINAGAADREVKARVPNAEAQTGDNFQRCRSAAIWLTAANIAPALPLLTAEGQDGYSYTRQSRDMERLAQTLREKALDALREVSATTRTPQFVVGSARRGR